MTHRNHHEEDAGTSDNAADERGRSRPGPLEGTGDEVDRPGFWQLRLYVAGQTPKSLKALANLKRLCEEHLAGKYSIEVVDLLEHPQLAAGDQILAIPTLVRRLPPPLRKIIGDLSNEEKVLVGLDLKPRA